MLFQTCVSFFLLLKHNFELYLMNVFAWKIIWKSMATSNSLVTNISSNIFTWFIFIICVHQRKLINSGLQQHESKMIRVNYNFHFWVNYFLKILRQGCPTLLLAIDCPAKFSSNSNQTQLKQLIKVFRIAWKWKTGVFDYSWSWTLQDSRSSEAGLCTPVLRYKIPFSVQLKSFCASFDIFFFYLNVSQEYQASKHSTWRPPPPHAKVLIIAHSKK